MKQYATYLRVSTQRQGAQGLGISAQRDMCDRFIKQNNGEHLQEFMDVESGTHRDRKGLWQAIEFCQKNDCSLVIAKLDRLARDVEFTFKVINTGIDIHFTDMPVVNSMILGVFSSVAQYEREMISKRTKDALAVKKSQGEKLGAASDKYKEAYKSKTKEERKAICVKKGKSRNARHLESKEVQMFKRILRNVFAEHTKDNDMANWNWKRIKTTDGYRQRVLSQMRDYREIDGSLFVNWDFKDLDSVELQRKLSNYIYSLKRSMARNISYNQ